ncbi:MAG: hypothetical protein JSU01_15770 [Bacteroidetes bacterium]|nr:hypothetical protein [Bacteroidota bacterium]
MENVNRTFDILKLLYKKGLHYKTDITDTLSEYFPRLDDSEDSISKQHERFNILLYPLQEKGFLKYYTHRKPNDIGVQQIFKWEALITAEGMEFYDKITIPKRNLKISNVALYISIVTLIIVILTYWRGCPNDNHNANRVPNADKKNQVESSNKSGQQSQVTPIVKQPTNQAKKTSPKKP